MSEPWMLEMSKHSMRCGLELEVEQVAQRAQQLLRLPARVLPLEVEGQAGVAHDELQQPQLLAALRHVDRAPPSRAARRATPRAARGRGSRCGTSDLARHVAPARVELLQRLGQHRLRLGQAVEQEALARHHLAVAHAEDLHRRALALDVRGEQVALLDVGGGDLLRRLEPHQRLHLVAQRRRLLVALRPRRGRHLLAQAPRHLLGAPLQEQPRVLARRGGSARASRSRPRTARGSA